jgi:regulator of sigma E protease
MLTLAAFIVAIALLVAVHEWGHFSIARMCGVRVLRFSVGFGPKILKWQSAQSGTEYVVCALPFGGYVKMLDEREGLVPEHLRALAFNTQSLKARTAIVAAGPCANLLLAVLLYAMVNWTGIEQAEAVVSRPIAASIAEKAGFQGGERIIAAGFEGETATPLDSFEDFRWWLTRAALAGRGLSVEYSRNSGVSRQVVLPLDTVDARNADASLFRAIGFTAPFSAARIGDIVKDSPASKAGLQPDDLVSVVNNIAIVDAAQLREMIRASHLAGKPQVQSWSIRRGGTALQVQVIPDVVEDNGAYIGRVGAYIGASPAMVTVRYGVVEGLQKSIVKTWEVSVLTLKMMGQILTGQSSIKNLSGPLTIADYAGKSAAMGITQFAVFLALVSISLGVLNLLPLPVLDGGHLMYYLWEAITGHPPKDLWMERLQRLGVGVLMMMMSVAVYNDLSRLLN